ncbi:MAG: hypothetical protein Q9159_004975 [Coniocarpon cinnabarinum]
MPGNKAIVIVNETSAAVEDVSIPPLRDEWVLIQVKAIALNPTDWKHIAWNGAQVGCRVGCDYAGIVTEVGAKVSKFVKGDRIAGWIHGSNRADPESGAFAQYAIAKACVQRKIPDHMSFEEAATLGVAIMTVGLGLYKDLELPLPSHPAKKPFPLLIYGGSTATGMAGIQLAKRSGLTVLTTCSPHNYKMMKSLGADAVFDYKSPTCAADIRNATNNNLIYAWDCTGDGAGICAAAVSDSKPGEYGSIMPADLDLLKSTNPHVNGHESVRGYDTMGEKYWFLGKTPIDPDLGDMRFYVSFLELTQGLLENGDLKPLKASINKTGSGLEGALVGLKDMEAGKLRDFLDIVAQPYVNHIMELDTDILIVGAGLAGLGFGVQLVASHYYSYSFEPNPNWSSKYPLQPEILAYLKGVASKYDIEKHIRFRSIVTSAHWEEASATWLVAVKDLETTQMTHRRCKALVSAVGVLSVPKECDVPGASAFQGRLFHTARWDHSFDWTNKEVVVLGNGCSATQAVPVISGGDKPVKKVTQFARQAQWIFERPNPQYSALFKWVMAYVPFAMRLYRLTQNYYAEMDFYSFDIVNGAGLRALYAKVGVDYMRRTAPEKYHDFLAPKTEVGCVRRVMDTDYFSSLNRDNVELVHADPVEEFVEGGVRTTSGRMVKADAVILANGFEVQKPLVSLNIFGEQGVSVAEHWDKFSEGTASAYFGTSLSEFPNFFILMGPNTASGHGNVLYVTECQINFALRALKPILRTLWAERSALSGVGSKADVIKVKAGAEQADIDHVQEKCKQLVWASGCTSWALDPATGRNTTMYPDFQYKFWLRSLFVPWRNFELLKIPRTAASTKHSRSMSLYILSGISTIIGLIAAIEAATK